MDLFLDIDGVLLTQRETLAIGAEAFLEWAVENHEPHWISTRTRDGTHRGAEKAFWGMIAPELIQAIKPVRWDTLKTEALPLKNRDWVWIDDELLPSERSVLVCHGVLDRRLQVNVNQNPSALLTLPRHPMLS